jgi:peptidoglycan/xylan/chitin deacetylase (PgdA/CDA1 family)
VTGLPGKGSNVALTIDDGADPDVVAAYCRLAAATGMRLTFFVTGQYPSWTRHKDLLRPLVDSGQVQLGNHTWTHAALTKLSAPAFTDEISRCEKLLTNVFGVTGKPFYRPPYGYYDAAVQRACADLGYSTTVMWYGSFGDSGLLTEVQLMTLARQWLQPQAVVIGHANHPTVTRLYGQIVELIRSRSLQTVTLDDAFYGPGGRKREATADSSYPTSQLAPNPGATAAPTPGGSSSTSTRGSGGRTTAPPSSPPPPTDG